MNIFRSPLQISSSAQGENNLFSSDLKRMPLSAGVSLNLSTGSTGLRSSIPRRTASPKRVLRVERRELIVRGEIGVREPSASGRPFS